MTCFVLVLGLGMGTVCMTGPVQAADESPRPDM